MALLDTMTVLSRKDLPVTHPPPPDPPPDPLRDPLWQSSPPPDPVLPDPVLQPPPPLPWDRPSQPSEPPATEPPATEPSDPPALQPWRRPTRPSAGSAAPTRAPHQRPGAPFRGATTSPGRPEPVRPKRRNWLIIGIITAILMICGGTIATGTDLGRRAEEVPATVAQPTPRPPTPRSAVPSPSPSLSSPITTVDGGPATSFGLPVGTAVRFSDLDGTWTVAMLGVEWRDGCTDFLGTTVPAIIFDIHYEVTKGAVSIIPLTDFTFVLADGTKARVGLLSNCAEPPLDYTIISEGEVHRGRIAIELPTGTDGVSGALTYGQLVIPTASWTVPARVGG